MRQASISIALVRRLLCCAALGLAAGAAHAQTGLKAPGTGSASKPAEKTGEGSAKAEEQSAGVKEVEAIFGCMAAGLPEGWRRAWVVVTELSENGKQRTYEGKFQYSLDASGANPVKLVPCNAHDVAERVYKLNDFLEPEKRGWKVATLIFTRDGKFELKYDYVK